MNVTANRSWIAIAAVAVVTILVQIPGLDTWYGQVSKEHTHVVSIVEGIIGVVLLFWAAPTVEKKL